MTSPKVHPSAVLALVAALATTASAQPVTPRVELDHPSVLAGGTRTVYALVDFEVVGPEAIGARPRPALNLALVIDRSGSMQDKGKIEYAREAAKRLVDGLAKTDRLALVEYDDRVTVPWPSALLDSPHAVKRLIDRLTPRGSTNLAGGLEKGLAEARKGAGDGRISRVVLLSDGLANQGITDPREIARMVREEGRAKGVQVTAMGLGADYNEDLMQAVAEHGGGHYYFVEHPNQLARIFQEELSVLHAAVARQVRLRIDRAPGVGRVEVVGWPSREDGRAVFVEQPDVHAGETRSLLVRVEVTPAAPGPLPIGTLTLEYEDLVGKRPVTQMRELAAIATADPAEVERLANARVAAESTLIEADRAQAETVKLYEAGDRAGAESRMNTLADDLARKNAALKDKRVAKKIEALRMERQEMTEAQATPTARSTYLKKTKLRGYLGTKGSRGKYLVMEGTRGYDTEQLQQALKSRGHYSGTIDGIYDEDVTAAVRAFQGAEGIEADGVAGPMTLKKLGLY